MLLPVRSCALQHFFLHQLQNFSRLCFDLVQRNFYLFSRIPAADDTLARLNIFRSDLHTNRYTAHLLLGKLPARALIAVVHLYPERAQPVLQFICFIQYAFLLLLDRNNHNLCRRNLRRQHQPGIVSVHHDHRTDQAGRRSPRGLMYIF